MRADDCSRTTKQRNGLPLVVVGSAENLKLHFGPARLPFISIIADFAESIDGLFLIDYNAAPFPTQGIGAAADEDYSISALLRMAIFAGIYERQQRECERSPHSLECCSR